MHRWNAAVICAETQYAKPAIEKHDIVVDNPTDNLRFFVER